MNPLLYLAALVNLSLIAIGALVIREGYQFGYALMMFGVICGTRVTMLMLMRRGVEA